MLFINLLQDAAPAPGGGGIQLIIMLVLMFAIMYFFMIRPQRKRQKEVQEFRNRLEIGSKIITSGGIYGVVKELNVGESYITIEVSKGVNIKIDRNCVFADQNQAAMSQQS